MRKRAGLLSILKGILLITSVVAIVVSPFMAKVWKEGEGLFLSRRKSSLERRLTELQSDAAVIEVDIHSLLTASRLRAYADDSLEVKRPGERDILVLRREKDGQVLRRDRGFYRWMLDVLGGE